jgi:hypothetical protein
VGKETRNQEDESREYTQTRRQLDMEKRGQGVKESRRKGVVKETRDKEKMRKRENETRRHRD